MKRQAIVLVGHGSRAKGFERAMERVARDLKRRERAEVVCAYLEITPPSVQGAIARCVRLGAEEVKVVPYFLLGGVHVTRDIPSIVAEARRRWARRAKITLCPFLGYDKRIAEVVKCRLEEKAGMG